MVSVPPSSVALIVSAPGALKTRVEPVRVNVPRSVTLDVVTTAPLVVLVVKVAENLPLFVKVSVPPVTVVVAPEASTHSIGGVTDESVKVVDALGDDE